MAISRVCWLLPLLSVLVQASHPDSLDYMSPHPKGWGALLRKIMAEHRKIMIDESKLIFHKAMEHLSNRLNTTIIPIKGEATHILVQTAAGNLYNMTMPVTEGKCPENRKPGKYEGCEPLPGAQKKLCFVTVLVLPGSREPFFHHEPCQDISSYMEPESPPPEEAEEEGTPYM